MENNAVLEVVLKCRDEASAAIEGMGKKVGGLSDILAGSFKNATIVSAAALAGLGAAAFTSITAFEESQKVMAQTEAVLKSTGTQAGVTENMITYLAGSLQRLTGISDEEIQSGENLLLTFTKISKDIFPDATRAIVDMSVSLGQDMKSSAIQLGKALNDPIVGITALKRVGVAFTESQKDQIKVLVESGNTLDAQKLILKELQTEFGGSAEAAGKTFAGQLKILKETVGDLQEELGGLLVKGLSPLIPKFQRIVDDIKNLMGEEITLSTFTKHLTEEFGVFGKVIGTTIEFFATHKEAIVAVAGVIGGVLSISIIAATVAMMSFIAVSLPVLLIFGAIGAGVAILISHWGQVIEVFNKIKPVLDGIRLAIVKWIKDNQETFIAFWEVIKGIFNFALGFIWGFWQTTWGAMKDYLLAVWEIMRGIIEVAWGVIEIFISIAMGIFTGNWTKAWEGIKKGFGSIWDGIKDILKGAIDFIISSIKLALDEIIGFINGVISGANNVMDKLPGNRNKIPLIPKFDTGGFVSQTGIALLHQGEFVLSKDMISGRQSVPQQINTNTSNQPITIYATVNQEVDLALLGNRIAFAIRNSR
jgi:hypothetical protein